MEQFHFSEKKITNGLKIISYALNSKGEYEQTQNDVWQPVTIVNQQAWQEIEKNVAVAKKNITAGRASCLHYYMVANQMDIGLLAQYTRQPRWKVCLHLIPFIFKRLSVVTLSKYSKLYNISPDDLINGKLHPPLYNYP
jgi:hypothetical protein